MKELESMFQLGIVVFGATLAIVGGYKAAMYILDLIF